MPIWSILLFFSGAVSACILYFFFCHYLLKFNFYFSYVFLVFLLNLYLFFTQLRLLGLPFELIFIFYRVKLC